MKTLMKTTVFFVKKKIILKCFLWFVFTVGVFPIRPLDHAANNDEEQARKLQIKLDTFLLSIVFYMKKQLLAFKGIVSRKFAMLLLVPLKS
jgi:hypothetical protein